MISRQANSFSYYCSLAGLSYDLKIESDGFLLDIGGYDDKIGVLIEKLIPIFTVNGFQFEMGRFESAKESIGDALKNTVFDLTYKYTPLSFVLFSLLSLLLYYFIAFFLSFLFLFFALVLLMSFSFKG